MAGLEADPLTAAASDRVASGAVKLQRGLKRLAIGLAVLWFVFWTFAYVFDPYTSLKPEVSFAVRVTAWSVAAPCLLTALVLGGWIAAGFWSE